MVSSILSILRVLPRSARVVEGTDNTDFKHKSLCQHTCLTDKAFAHLYKRLQAAASIGRLAMAHASEQLTSSAFRASSLSSGLPTAAAMAGGMKEGMYFALPFLLPPGIRSEV